MKFNINYILHASFIVEDLDRSLKFYKGVLGLKEDDSRPEMSYPGAWLKLGDEQQLHLLRLPNPDPKDRPEHGGHDRHIALKVNSLDELKKRLTENNISYSQSQSRAHVIFIRDPDCNTLELISDSV